MAVDTEPHLTTDDITRLGVEAAMAVLAMPDAPSPADVEKAKIDLGMRATELRFRQATNPDGGEV